MKDIPYVIVGRLYNEPTEAQNSRAMKTGGWNQREIKELTVLWNACVSPPFGGDPYNFDDGRFTREEE